MPRYDYQCAKGHVFEFERPFGSSSEPKSCPECGSKKLERLLVPPPVQFKGSGWYKTDNRKPSAAPKAEETRTEPAKETKPAPADKSAPEKPRTEPKTESKKDAA